MGKLDTLFLKVINDDELVKAFDINSVGGILPNTAFISSEEFSQILRIGLTICNL